MEKKRLHAGGTHERVSTSRRPIQTVERAEPEPVKPIFNGDSFAGNFRVGGSFRLLSALLVARRCYIQRLQTTADCLMPHVVSAYDVRVVSRTFLKCAILVGRPRASTCRSALQERYRMRSVVFGQVVRHT